MATMSVATTPLTSAGLENLMTTLLERFETACLEQQEAGNGNKMRVPMQAEIRSLDFWRSIVAECLASFFLVFIVCGSFIPWSGHTPPAISIALASGFAVAALTLSFAQISGAHLNPVMSLALLVTRKISPMKALLYVTSQGGGAIAGAALLYGVTSPGHQGYLGATIVSTGLTDWQALGIELCLTFVITLVYLTTMDDHRRGLSASIGPGPITLGLTYTACSFVALPSTGASFNPMRSLGPAFVMNKWDAHWVYWLGPIVGGCLAAILYEFIFNPYRNSQRRKGSIPDGDASSIHSDEDNYDDVKSTVANYQSARSQHYDQYRPAISPGGPSNPISPSGAGVGGAVGNNWRNQQRMERAESVYGGTKSLYHCGKSPGPPSRSSNLNRSQSVYAKPPAAPAVQPPNVYASRGAQLQSAQSTYLAARNVDLIRTESIYATRQPPAPMASGNSSRAESVYGSRHPRHMADMTDVDRPVRDNSLLTSSVAREPVYATRAPSHDRSKPESYQLEPIYQTRREVVPSVAAVEPAQRGESLYDRKVPTYRPEATVAAYNRRPNPEQMETSATSAGGAPISPSDTSKDSAYGSVHGTSIQSPAEWAGHGQENNQSNYNQQQQQQQQQHVQHLQHASAFSPHLPNQPPQGSYQIQQQQQQAGHHHHYAQKFRADLMSPNSQQHSPGSFHSPVQY
ncbi:neurogenic protein big brain-like [Daphnia pulicaria]|uniref:neurogenic protein big brain-like n=1 Tax=Daphnia pulicaria TaxID=35523 RepID=UPI001EEB9B94|nr:neurogenic protein big brain-like [Daphnia pulicaria]